MSTAIIDNTTARFTKASEKDLHKVTVSLKDLSELIDLPVNHLERGALLVLKFGGNRRVLFEVNRAGKTAATNAWPLTMPRVGAPVARQVLAVERVFA